MEYRNCPLFGIKSKKLLKFILHIENEKLFKQSYVASLIVPYIDRNGKPRLIEKPLSEIKIIQKRIKTLLGKIDIPNNVFSGIKGRSYVDNAKMHLGTNRRNIYKIDFTAFFPSISRERVYKFFYNNLNCSQDIAEILTNFTTIDLKRLKLEKADEIYDFLNHKGVKCFNHLISGSPTSQILSYLVNYDMFRELQNLSNKNGVIMTIYVDDIVFSSEHKISCNFRKSVKSIIKKYCYRISKGKEKLYSKTYPKLVTGVIIDSTGKTTKKNSTRFKISREFNNLKNNQKNEHIKQKLRGLINAARQVERTAYPNMYKLTFKKGST